MDDPLLAVIVEEIQAHPEKGFPFAGIWNRRCTTPAGVITAGRV